MDSAENNFIEIITISDDVISVSSSSDESDNKVAGEIVTISSDVISVSDESKNISVSSESEECENAVITISASDSSIASFDFETPQRVLLPQPRTSTPFPRRRIVQTDEENCEFLSFSVYLVYLITIFV